MPCPEVLVPLIDALTPRLHAVLDIRMAQHAVLASNLANSDTPGFIAKSVDFERALALALDPPERPLLHDARHVEIAGADPRKPPLMEEEPAPWSVDGNSVQPERETARSQANAIQYEAVSRGLSDHLAMLRFAVSDGRG